MFSRCIVFENLVIHNQYSMFFKAGALRGSGRAYGGRGQSGCLKCLHGLIVPTKGPSVRMDALDYGDLQAEYGIDSQIAILIRLNMTERQQARNQNQICFIRGSDIGRSVHDFEGWLPLMQRR